MDPLNDCVIIEAESGQHSATLIFLHGRGDTGHGWAETFAHIKPNYLKCICPTAPKIAITLADGCEMNAWFDLLTPYGKVGPENESGIQSMSQKVHNLIEKEISVHSIPASRIILGGYSQGGGLALYSGLTYHTQLAAIIAISCWLPLRNEFPEVIKEELKTIPILQCHGEADPVIPCDWSLMTMSALKSVMSNYCIKTYPHLGHSTFPPEIRDVREFITKCLPPLRR